MAGTHRLGVRPAPRHRLLLPTMEGRWFPEPRRLVEIFALYLEQWVSKLRPDGMDRSTINPSLPQDVVRVLRLPTRHFRPRLLGSLLLAHLGYDQLMGLALAHRSRMGRWVPCQRLSSSHGQQLLPRYTQHRRDSCG